MDRRFVQAISVAIPALALFLLGFTVAHTFFSNNAGAAAKQTRPSESTLGVKVPAATSTPAGVITAAEPATAVPPTAVPATTLPSGISLEVKVGQLIMAGLPGQTVDSQVGDLIDNYHLGNVVFLSRNTGTPEEILSLTTALQERAQAANGVGMLIAADQEGGRVIRLAPPFVQFPAARVIGCIGSPVFARGAARITGDEMRAVGINVNLAPVADVVDNPANQVIGDRSFGTTADEVVQVLPAYVGGLRDSGVAATLKHFPGHGSTNGDSHYSVVTVTKTLAQLEQTELPPFRSSAGIADLVMTANVGYPALDPSGLPASLSKPIVDFLRLNVGFSGVVITDDLEMAAIQDRWSTSEAGVMALNAGVDLLLVNSSGDIPALHDAIVEAVRSGVVSEARIDESLQRVLALKNQLLAAGVIPIDPIEEDGTGPHHDFVAFLGTAAVKKGCQ